MSKKSAHLSSKFWFAAVFASFAALLLLSAFSVKNPADARETEALQAVVRYSENFDAVSAPQLPNGWTTSSAGAGSNFATVTNFNHSAPNAVFAPNAPATGLSEITSPPVLVTGTRTVLNFRHKYSVENTWDGGVLEIKIGGGQFQDILVAGGTFLAGGYTTTLNSSPNPLAGRLAWSGATQEDFLLTSVQLPSTAFGQTVEFRWRLGSNNGFASLGWWIDSVTLETQPTGANTNAIGIAPAGTANPYPSDIQISGLAGLITGVTVNLENFSHTSPDDVDILLVAPNGRRIVLLSDAGGATGANNLSMTFSDSAGSFLPDESPLVSGIFKPTNYDATDTFPSPAPQEGAVSGAALGAFYGSNPNGTWSLYVVDDNGGNAGTIAGGWNMDIQTSLSACLFTISPAAQAFSAAGGSGNFQINTPAGCNWSVSTNSAFVAIDSPPAGSNNGVVNFTVAANSGAARTGFINITDGFNSRSFQIQQGAGCPASLAQTSLSFTAAGGSGSVAVTAGAGCAWQAVSDVNWITVNSAPQTGNGAAAFNVLPNPARNARSAAVTIGARILTINQAGISATRFDFDGDRRADISVYRGGTWYLLQSTNGFGAAQFGLDNDKLATADYDGDGRSDIAVYRDGIWYVLQSSNAAVFAVQFGIAGDVPVPADYTGDGRAELAVFRNGTWYTLNLATNQTSIVQFGLAGDKPVTADYDGDGKADFAVYRGGTWYLQRSTLGFAAVQFGVSSDKPAVGDYDGDGKSDLTVYRDGVWHILTNFQNYSVAGFGLAADIPAPADYDGDGKTDLAVYRDGTWYILQTSNGAVVIAQFGLASDIPVPGTF
ncbi:MAG TPA: proprotein convertase P-domain-containing protein [Pyrinomonadaceae bacterium]|jgi:(2Fe-2S) ferredoxin/subtilisin-like proprotein convertase family protein